MQISCPTCSGLLMRTRAVHLKRSGGRWGCSHTCVRLDNSRTRGSVGTPSTLRRTVSQETLDSGDGVRGVELGGRRLLGLHR